MRRISFLLIIVVSLGVFQFLMAGNPLQENIDMNSIISDLKSQKIDFFIFTNSQGNQFLIVPKFGARILAAS
ncbi:MAG: hypothetical protein H8E54_11345, partial [Candidatus Aminicenantes bacterium]|nr:hypothetical protein [Candidatus Aminicenantes bacterium]